jgi:hypothetical protein
LEAVKNYSNGEGLNAMCVLGLQSEDGEDVEEEDESKSYDSMTQEQAENLRYVIITKRRAADMIDKMEELVLGDQAGDSFMMFNTSFSYEVIDSYNKFSSRLTRNKDKAVQFDTLFGYTYTLRSNDVWMHDHECGWGGHRFISALAKRWKTILALSDEELGIKDSFTRAGVVTFLNQFKNLVESIEQFDEPDVKFNFM